MEVANDWIGYLPDLDAHNIGDYVLIAELESASEAPGYGRILGALREMGPSAMAAVPVIIKTIKDQRGMLNNHDIDLLKALEEFDPEAATKAGVK
jgi:hypothetical protein